MATDVKFYRGVSAAIPQAIEDGAIYVATDTSKLYIDAGQQRIEISGGGGGSSAVSVAKTLTASGWSNNSQTVSVEGVTATNSVIVGPAPNSADEYSGYGILCTQQSAGSLTFTADITPTVNIEVNILIL